MARLLVLALVLLAGACSKSTAPSEDEQVGRPPVVAPAAPADRAQAAEVRLGKVADALDAWLAKHLDYPDRLEVLIRDDLARPADFDDPWGHRIDYTRKGSRAYALCSRGPDNLPKTEDDVCLPGAPGKR